MMRTIMIVDDESFIRLGIKSIIERHPSSNYEIILASNGIEALSIIENKHIDILITDIRMPKMDGLTLIHTLKCKKNNTQAVILSGFDDFTYASEAIKYGVKEYLLKPVKRDDIFECLARLEADIELNEENNNKIEIATRYVEQYKMSEFSYIFLKDNIRKEEIIDVINRMDIDILKGYFYFGLIKRKGMNVELNLKGFIKEINNILNSYRNIKSEFLIYPGIGENVIIISKDKELFKFLEQYIETNNSLKFYVGIKEGTVRAEEIKSAYNEAKRALNYRFLYSSKYFFIFSEIEALNMNYSIPSESIVKLYNMICSNREKNIEGIIIEIMNINTIKAYDISYFEGIFKEIKSTILNNIKTRYFNERDIPFANADKLTSLNNYDSFSEYYHDLKIYLFNVNEYLNSIKDVYGEKKQLDRAVEYINKNYTNREINLSMVSNEVSMNYSYFSQVFKEYVGENFVNYIQRLRIDKAKKLFESYDYKVYEIADKVGYEDSKQFAKVFRKITGITPKEYKDKYIKK